MGLNAFHVTKPYLLWHQISLRPTAEWIWSTIGIAVNLEVGSFLSDIYLQVKVSVLYATRNGHEKRKAAPGQNGNGNSKRNCQYFLVTFAEFIFSSFPKSGKTITVASKGKCFFLLLSMWSRLSSGKSCWACFVQWCVEPATVHCTRRKTLQYRNLCKGRVFSKSHLAPACVTPCFLFFFKKGKFHWYFISFFTHEKFDVFRMWPTYDENILMMSAAIREMTMLDRKRGMCLPVAGMVSGSAPCQGRGRLKDWILTRNWLHWPARAARLSWMIMKSLAAQCVAMLEKLLMQLQPVNDRWAHDKCQLMTSVSL